MYNIFEKLIAGSVIIGMALLILFANSEIRTEISTNTLENDPVEVKAVEIPVMVDEVVEMAEETVVEEAVLEVVEITPPFNEAFEQARAELGPGQVFEWNGNLYVTDYFEEMQVTMEQYVDDSDQTFAYQDEQ